MLKTVSFKSVDQDWFNSHSLGDPSLAFAHWQVWYKKNRNRKIETILRKLLALASGLSEGAVRHYRCGRALKLSEKTCAELDKMPR